MRTLRLSLAGTVILALLGGLGGVVTAQDPEAATWTHVTGSTVEDDDGWTEDATPVRWEDSVQFLPTFSQTFTVDWSDPRLPETIHLQRAPVMHHGDMASDQDFMFVFADSVRLEDTVGAWAGSGRGVIGSDGNFTRYELTGEGGYEGLGALLNLHDDGESPIWTFDGFIFESELPSVPALEPPAAATAATEEVMAESHESEDAAVEATEQPEAPVDEDADLSGTAVYIDGLRTWQYWEGDDTIYELEMSDPRANGTYTESDFVGDGYDSESAQPSIAALGHVTLVNDEGSWSGHESAVWDDEMGWRLTAWLDGEDAYEGLTLYLHAHRFPVYSTPEMEFDGVIFDGEPPVMLEAVSLPTE